MGQSLPPHAVGRSGLRERLLLSIPSNWFGRVQGKRIPKQDRLADTPQHVPRDGRRALGHGRAKGRAI